VSFVFCARNALPHGLSGLQRDRHRVDLLDDIDIAIDGHVQPRREQVLVERCAKPRRHLGGVPVRAAIIGCAALTLESPVWIATAVNGGLLATGFAVYALRSRHVPGLAEHVGVFDETIADDVLADYNPWMVRR
jgi:hypothetical protein